MIQLFKKDLDRTTVIFSLFILFIAILFAYIFTIEKKMNHYAQENAKIVQLQLLDKELDNFSLATNKFSNYDTIDTKEKIFEKNLHELKEYLHRYEQDNKKVQELLDKITKDYQIKIDDLEYFKATNASLINSTHFLFDLQSTISKDPNLSFQAKYAVNELLFYLLKYSTTDYIDKQVIEKSLQKVKSLANKLHNKHLQTFYTQSKLMLQTMQAIKEVSLDIQHNPLYSEIQELQRVLTENYNQDIFKQTIVASVLFIFTLLLLLFLILSHLRSVQTKRELYAFRFAIEHSDNTVVITDPNKNITYVNETFEKVTGYLQHEVLGKNPNILKSGVQTDAFYKELNETIARGETWEGQFVNKRKDGSLFYEKASIVPVSLNNKLLGYLSLKLDISEYIEQNQKLAQAASVFENTEEAIIIADKECKIVSINSAFSRIYGYTLEEAQGESLRLLHSKEQNEKFYQEMWKQIESRGIWRGKIINRTKDGELIPVWTTIKRIVNEKGEVVNYTAIQADLREIENSQAKADYLAYHDPLTGLYNRINFEEYLRHALSLAKRNGSIVAILFIDLDRFKVINDTLGHDIGDKVLIKVAQKLKTILRESDFIARWGGDEFVVILENLTSQSDAAIIAHHIIDALQHPIEVNQHKLLTTASIGISLYPDNGSDIQTLIKHADSAMYLAKDEGKNSYRYYTQDLSREIQRKLDIDMALHNALTNREMYMMFQPQYSLKTQKIVSAEALIRWQSPQLGLVPPDQFIPIAEDSGAIIKIGYFVFEESCKAFCKFRDAGLHLDYIAVNVSSIQFREIHLLDTFLSIIHRYGLHPSDIEIEITERFMMEQTVQNIRLLQRFREKGFKISIDDFGTGYSSMSYLKELPVDTLKIDKSFVSDIGEGSSNNVIIEAIIALAKTLDYSIIAEGIETKEQECFLQTLQCDLGQGYLFSKPKKADELIQEYTS
ncbi:MAG: EAL domain-containing protein [Epsilonproteobacteria bacterium]|nr:EAL domain-containing protein [Campylobacterota bacterium]